MAQTKKGALKVAAKKLGLSLDDYLQHIRNFEKWCSICKKWHGINTFGKDITRGDGLVPACRDSRNKKLRDKYTPKPRKRGRRFANARNGDKFQARGRTNYLINIGLLPSPNDLPCVDCGDIYDGKARHEYDHYLGYTEDNHDEVEAVCSKCHHKRHPLSRSRDKQGRFSNG